VENIVKRVDHIDPVRNILTDIKSDCKEKIAAISQTAQKYA
jgi:hypothetical protein